MEQLNNLEDLFHHQLKDLYSAEIQLAEALPEIRDQASSQPLHDTLSDQLAKTEEHKARLTDIAKTIDLDLTGETCEAMKGLIKEAKSFMSEGAAPQVQDAGLIADVQRINHYEISAYGTALQFAKVLNHQVAIDKLQLSLNEEKNADQELTIVAEENINPKAKQA